jgi:hypothetical protein
MKKSLRIVGITIIVLLAIVLFLYIAASMAPAPKVIANFTELNKIGKISKYRSCAGHTTVPQDESESKRSMKHYFMVNAEYLGNDTVAIYAPFDGIVTTVRQDLSDGLEGEIWIVPNDLFALMPPVGRWSFSVQHINIRDGLNRGNSVKAGELIGYAAVSGGVRNTFDVVYAKGALFPKEIDNWNGPFKKLDSIFNHVSDDIFAKYREMGVESRNDFIISREERDINPCTYKDDGPYFMNQDNPKNWVTLIPVDAFSE